MTDRFDSKIRAFVVELLDQPVEPPPLPAARRSGPQQTRFETHQTYRGWLIAAAAFVAVLIAGAAVLLPYREDTPPMGPGDVVGSMVTDLNAGDLGATLDWFAEDALCVAPGLPSCFDLFGFFTAADAEMSFTGCQVEVDPYLQCRGIVHTSIHTALGITFEDLQLTPNFPPAFIVEDGLITQMNFSTPFTGDPDLDDELWGFLVETDADFVSADGVPRFSADIVEAFTAAAVRFAARPDGAG